MKIVIDIDEDYYDIIRDVVERGIDHFPYVLIANGTLLEEHCTSCIYMPIESEDE